MTVTVTVTARRCQTSLTRIASHGASDSDPGRTFPLNGRRAPAAARPSLRLVVVVRPSLRLVVVTHWVTDDSRWADGSSSDSETDYQSESKYYVTSH